MDTQQSTKQPDVLVEVSFIIPHRGRIHYLIDTIRSITEQAYCQAKIEIIVITQETDLCVTDITQQIEEITDIQIRVLNEASTHTISSLRNIGASMASGKYISFVDADIALSADWITTMIELLESDSRRIIVSAVQHPSEGANWLENVRSALSNVKSDSRVMFLPGRNLLMKKESFNMIGGFPEALRTCEDYYFTNKASTHGDLFYSSDSSYVHLGEDKQLLSLFKKEIWRGYSNIDSLYGRKISLEEIPSFIVPIAVLLSFMASAISAAIGMPLISLAMVMLMQLAVVIYTYRLMKSSPGDVHCISVMLFYNVYFIGRGFGMVKERWDVTMKLLLRKKH